MKENEVSVLDQYDIDIKSTRRIRDAENQPSRRAKPDAGASKAAFPRWNVGTIHCTKMCLQPVNLRPTLPMLIKRMTT